MKIGLVLPIGFRGMARCSKGKGLAVIPRKRLQLAGVPFLGSGLVSLLLPRWGKALGILLLSSDGNCPF